MRRLKIPQTDSIEELAQFWQTHDITDFEGELEEDKESIFERSKRTVSDVDKEYEAGFD